MWQMRSGTLAVINRAALDNGFLFGMWSGISRRASVRFLLCQKRTACAFTSYGHFLFFCFLFSSWNCLHVSLLISSFLRLQLVEVSLQSLLLCCMESESRFNKLIQSFDHKAVTRTYVCSLVQMYSMDTRLEVLGIDRHGENMSSYWSWIASLKPCWKITNHQMRQVW